MDIGDMGVPFIYQGEELIYPEYVKDGLVLHYDFSGMTNNDASKDIARDLSGNGNHGTLQNFNYTAESGYDKNKLLFDEVDDFLQVPEIGLNPESMAVVDNGNIYSYEGEVVRSIGDDNEVVIGGVNMIIRKGEIKRAMIGSDGSYSHYFKTSATPDFLNVYPGETLHLKRTTVEEDESGHLLNYWRYAWFDKDGNFISRHSTSSATTVITVPSQSYKLKISYPEGATVKIERGSVGSFYSPAPKDFLITTYSPTVMKNLLLYNRPLTPSEIAHNYAIEKERFGNE